VTDEYAGITIIIDQGPRRTVVNVPHAEDVRVDAVDDRRRRDDLCPPFFAPPIVDEPVLMRLNFRPIGEYTSPRGTQPHAPHRPRSLRARTGRGRPVRHPRRRERRRLVTVTKRELLTVASIDDDPKAIINALLELPQDLHLTSIEISEERQNWAGHRFAAVPVTFTFERRTTDG
jgi:hypothetical protein